MCGLSIFSGNIFKHLIKHPRKILTRVLSCSLAMLSALTIATNPAYAIVKEVQVFGVKSINDMALSDHRITMDKLKDNYSGFVQTSTLREYFHKDQPDPVKVDLGEELSWLVDHDIISRDTNIVVSNINDVPSVTIQKFDPYTLKATRVHRTDLIMYMYKAAFGPIEARAVGVETPNVRVDNGTVKTLADMMIDHEYFTGITSQVLHSVNGFVTDEAGQPGGYALAQYLNDATNWRYQPQGDLWESIFGDTNIFISQNQFTQSIDDNTGGRGGDNNGIGSGGPGGDVVTGDNTIDYETDYKQIYFVPGADMLFYNTSDVPEVYIQAALSKGLIDFEKDYRTPLFTKEFLDFPEQNPTMYQSWDSTAPPFIVNRHVNTLQKVANVEQVSIANSLGTSWKVNYTGDTLSLVRLNPFASETGYFTTEYITKMDVYRYAYNFIYANEKVLSDLERDIVNYKYSMELDGITNEEDTNIIKYLIAKGILNYDITDEFRNLNQEISWNDLLKILYRVANKDARFDFSEVQLTDSETQWKAEGYAPRTIAIIRGNSYGQLRVMTEEEAANQGFGTSNYQSNEENSNNSSRISSTDPLNIATTSGDDGRNYVTFGADSKTKLVSGAQVPLADFNDNGISFSFSGITYNSKNAFYNSEQVTEEDIYGNVADNASYFGISAPSTPMGKRFLYLVRNFWEQTTELDLTPNWTSKPHNTPGYLLYHQFLCNFWALCDMNANADSSKDIKNIINGVENWGKKIEKGLEDGTYTVDKSSKSIFTRGRITNFIETAADMKVTLTNNLTYIKNADIKLSLFAGNGSTESGSWPRSLNWNVTDLLNRIVGIEYKVIDGDDQQTHELSCTPPDPGNLRASKSSEEDAITKIDNNIKFIYKSTSSKEKDEAILLQTERNKLKNLSAFANASAKVDLTVQISMGSGDTEYVSWSEIADCAKSNSDDVEIPLQRESDVILYNEETQTRAYFSSQDNYSFAIVGTMVVRSQDGKPLIKKQSNEIYYSMAVIRLMLNAQQAGELLGGVESLSLEDEAAAENLTKVLMDDGSGSDLPGVYGLKVMITDNDAKTIAKEGLTTGSAEGPSYLYFKGDIVDGTKARWGTFVTLSQANRMINVISREISYKVGDETRYAFAIVQFKPVPLSKIADSTVLTEADSFQDLLDAPLKEPTSKQAKVQWDQNKTKCNAYANWIYGTTDATYINSGYFDAKAYLYGTDKSLISNIPESAFAPLDNSQISAIECFPLKEIGDGAVLGIKDDIHTMKPYVPAQLRYDARHRTSYLLSTDYRIVVIGSRVYINIDSFDNLTYSRTPDGDILYRANNIAMGNATFTVGSTFRSRFGDGDSTEGRTLSSAKVIETRTDGTVICQVGPIVGVPINVNGKAAIIRNYPVKASSGKTIGEYDWSSADNDLCRYFYETLFNQAPYSGIKYGGIKDNPLDINATLTTSLIFNGDELLFRNKQYGSDRSHITLLTSSVNSNLKNIKVSNYISTINNQLSFKDKRVSLTTENTGAYFTISFNAMDYTIDSRGILQHRSLTATDLISPSLFTNLNDLIIEDLIAVDRAAIPVEQVPEGALLLIGTDYYAASGSSDIEKSFIGYAAVTGSETMKRTKATLQDALPSFAGQVIKVGNQVINVTHFFETVSVLDSYDSKVSTALQLVVDNGMHSDGISRYAILGKTNESSGTAERVTIMRGKNAGGAKTYIPLQIKFQRGSLMAYPFVGSGAASDTVSTSTPIYKILPTADTGLIGPLENLPFFTDNILENSLVDATTELLSGSYIKFYGAKALLQDLKEDFQKALAGDVFTLARMLVFIVLVWLLVASWICYMFYVSGLMPILDAIRYPTVDRSGKGIDLMKIISLGSITMESDFNLGRFIQYDIIICILLVVVWKTGSISLPL